MVSIETSPLCGHAVQFSPFAGNRLAFAGAENYGIAGAGACVLFEKDATGAWHQLEKLQWQDACYDVSWSEASENVLLVATGNGGVVVWDTTQPQECLLQGHTAEVSSVEWDLSRLHHHVISSSWDHTVRLWDIPQQSCVSVLSGHSEIVYRACWSPLLPSTVASVSRDQMLCLWDLSKPAHPVSQVNVHQSEVLTCDWSKYDQFKLCTGAVDGCIRGWDIRHINQPLFNIHAHSKAIRNIKCDPHSSNAVASCSYDFTVRLWDMRHNNPIENVAHHTEFTFGLDISLHEKGTMVDCSWDKTIKVYTPASLALFPP
ncbi:peroxisomal targeting signal 2 receptor-like [Dysidea avara]|uniref:peroxisomal targeting signal 2 receptor-like n=1 Tax=Dysidea avara TaxID=196820 RepID=UPI0033279AA5